MAQINKPTDYFNTVLYTGNGTDNRSITGLDFQPDWVWIKERDDINAHYIFDSVRGIDKQLQSNSDSAEYDYSGDPNRTLKSFDSDGFTLGTGAGVNGSGELFVAWNWLASNTTASNTDGSITSTVSANTTSGFSIVKWTGTGSSETIGHGLGVAPKVVIVKRYSAVADWVYYTTAIDGSLDYLFLNTTAAKADTSVSVPTSTVFSKSDTNNETQIAYCFAEKKGFSKFGSYTGNGNADGTFVYTGFKPAWVMRKRTDGANQWGMNDNKRNTFNITEELLSANLSNAASNGTGIDILSNGFKMRTDSGLHNALGGTYIYMAFAESPLVGTNNIPATAR